MEIPDIYKTTSLNGARLLCLLLIVFTSGCEKKTGSEAKTKELVFKLDEVSAFKVIGQSASFVRGQRGECSSEPDMSVKAWPAFKSDKQLYGSVWFAGKYAEKKSGIQYYFVLDESAGTGNGYDRLYFDLNRDLDLTNDSPVVPQKEPPDNAMLDYSWIEQQVCFDYLYVDFGPDGKRSLEIMPRLTISDSGYSTLSFVATKVRKGKCKIAGQRYAVLLGHAYSVGGRFDLPATALYMIPKGDFKHQPSWWCAELLMAMHKIRGTYYRFSSTPTGDQLIVRPYNGEFGTFKIGSGGRAIRAKKVSGSLRSKDAAVAVGGDLENHWLQAARSCRLPVGDYLPTFLTINFGDLRISVSDNYHSEGKLRDRGGRPYVYGIKIRKDKPFSLDFSNEPEVMFVSPVRDHRVKPGEELVVKAILTDPKLDIMIRGLDAKQFSRRVSSLRPLAILAIVLAALAILSLLSPRFRQRYRYMLPVSVVGLIAVIGFLIVLSSIHNRLGDLGYKKLNPKVIITRADGEKVAEGVMPFG